MRRDLKTARNGMPLRPGIAISDAALAAVGRPRIAEYQQVIAEQPDSAEAADAQYRIGCIYALYAEYDQAIAQLTSLIEQHPDSTAAVQAFDLLQVVFSQPDRQQQGLAVLPALVDTYYPDSPQMLLKKLALFSVATMCTATSA